MSSDSVERPAGPPDRGAHLETLFAALSSALLFALFLLLPLAGSAALAFLGVPLVRLTHRRGLVPGVAASAVAAGILAGLGWTTGGAAAAAAAGVLALLSMGLPVLFAGAVRMGRSPSSAFLLLCAAGFLLLGAALLLRDASGAPSVAREIGAAFDGIAPSAPASPGKPGVDPETAARVAATFSRFKQLAQTYWVGLVGASWVLAAALAFYVGARAARPAPSAEITRFEALRVPAPVVALFAASGAGFAPLRRPSTVRGGGRPPRPVRRDHPLRGAPRARSRRGALRGFRGGFRASPRPFSDLGGRSAAAALRLVLSGRALYHLPLRPKVVSGADPPSRSVRPRGVFPAERGGGSAGPFRLVCGFSPPRRESVETAMKVILADDVRGLGHRGDTVTVKPGYARNFLFPQGFAYEANDANVRKLSEEKKKYDVKMSHQKTAAEETAKRMEGLTVSVTKKAGDEGVLYGSVTSTDIADALTARGIDVDRRRIEVAEPIKRIGQHTVHIRLHRDVTTVLTVDVQPLSAVTQ